MKVIFRLDASSTIGGGHAVRCHVLADKLKESGCEVIFASTTPQIQNFSYAGNYAVNYLWIESSGLDEYQELQEKFPGGCDLLIVDHYELNAQFEQQCQGWAKRIFVIDDLCNQYHDCDFILNSNPHISPNDYARIVKSDCKLLLGPHYALIRNSFVRLRSIATDKRSDMISINRIFINYGAVDNNNYTIMALNAINKVTPNIPVDVVMGSYSPHLELIQNMVQNKFSTRVNLHVDATHIPELMLSADLAFGASGIAAYERCCLGLPTILTISADNQKLFAASLQTLKAVYPINTDLSTIYEDMLIKAYQECIDNIELTKSISREALNVCDGLGAERVIAALHN